MERERFTRKNGSKIVAGDVGDAGAVVAHAEDHALIVAGGGELDRDAVGERVLDGVVSAMSAVIRSRSFPSGSSSTATHARERRAELVADVEQQLIARGDHAGECNEVKQGLPYFPIVANPLIPYIADSIPHWP